MSERSYTIPAIRFAQDGVSLYLTAMESGTIHDVAQVDVYKPQLQDDDPDQGYQRDIIRAHARKFARFMLDEDEDRLLPTAGVLSARAPLDFTPADGQGSGPIVFGTVTLRSSDPIYHVDGQHRDAGMAIAMLEDSELTEFRRPMVILEGIEKLEEIRQFVIINQTAKRIRTDLADRLLRELGEFDERREGWRAKALDIVDLLNSASGSPWKGRIKMPNSKEGVASQRTWTESLKPVLDGVLGDRDADVLAGALDNFWKALRNLMPEAFAEPSRYVLQKSVGVFAWNEVAAVVFRNCLAAGADFSVGKMEEMLKHTDQFVEADFWLGKRSGGQAPLYGGRGGFATLAGLIIDQLPEAEVTINL